MVNKTILALMVVATISTTGCAGNKQLQQDGTIEQLDSHSKETNDIIFTKGMLVESAVKYAANSYHYDINWNVSDALMNAKINKTIEIHADDLINGVIGKIVAGNGLNVSVNNMDKNVVVSDNVSNSDKRNALTKHKIFKSEVGKLVSANIMDVVSGQGYQIVWDLSESASTKLHTPLLSEMTFNIDSMDSLVSDLKMNIEALTKESVFVELSPKEKALVIHQYGIDNVSVFEVKKGRLSSNVSRLAKQFGWTLNRDYGWLAKNDYTISIDYPISSQNNIEAALNKMLVMYSNKLKFQLLESSKQVFIVDAK